MMDLRPMFWSVADASPRRGRMRAAYALAFALAAILPARGQALSPAAPARMAVEARELVYDENRNTVAAQGDVQIYYKGRLLEADKVIYDRKTGRVLAEGHVRETERNGVITRAERLDMTDDFKDGFIESLQVDTTDDTHFSAPRAERSAGETTVFDLGTYTACDACKNDPTKPRTWRLRAKRIIHEASEKTIYYEDAYLEFLNVPVAYVPFWSSPDQTANRKSGLLAPVLPYSNQLGFGFGLPVFWAIAPDRDLTLTPTYFTKQGAYLAGEYRQRFENGVVRFSAEGAHVNDPGAFAPAPIGAGDRLWRGSLHSDGEFALNDFWRFGWSGTLLTDRYFIQDYRIPNDFLQNYYFRENSSTIYLTGQGPRSYFDLRGYYFQGLSPNDVQSQLPIAHPVLDYNRAFDVDPAKTFGVGGQIEIDANITSSSAQTANYESIQPRTLDSIYGLYNVCQLYAPAPNRAQSDCLLRNVGGDYDAGTLMASWKRKFIDPVGGVWEPFAFSRFFGSYLDYNTSGVAPIYNASYQPIPNAAQGAFVNGADNTFRGQVTPGGGVEWRYPILARGPIGDLVVEPIGQLVARPNQSSIPSLVNIDAQSLVFDDTTLFEWSKFSGYDRFETGTRLNYGGQATLTASNGAYVNGLIGQSLQVAGGNPYGTPDAANVGLESGLNHRVSDIIGRFALAPISTVNFVAKGSFDPDSLTARRIDLFTSLKLQPATFELHYANYVAQPEIGFDKRRQGMAVSGRYELTPNYFVSGAVTFDMSRYLYNSLTADPLTNTILTGSTLVGTAPVFSIATLGIGGGYHDECTTFTVNYSSRYQPQASGQPARNQTILLSLQLRTLGTLKTSVSLGSVPINDGVRAQP
jgi:LPS-assembly protein